jgi:hypothetical protein
VTGVAEQVVDAEGWLLGAPAGLAVMVAVAATMCVILFHYLPLVSGCQSSDGPVIVCDTSVMVLRRCHDESLIVACYGGCYLQSVISCE